VRERQSKVVRSPIRQSDRRGVTLAELLLVTVILGLLASIVAPYFGRARERAIVTTMHADLRNLTMAVETYVTAESSWPRRIEDVQELVGYTLSEGVEVCIYIGTPRSAFREGYFLAILGHARTTTKLFTAYPLWGSRVIEYQTSSVGC
jgi:prepilin-type N-terminal cleavage/methylation domain-containing protein